MQPSVIVFDESLTLGRKVRILRIARGWRQSDLAFYARVTPSAVSTLERDMPCYPGVIERVCAVLGIAAEDEA